MTVFYWGAAILFALTFGASAVCYAVHIAIDDLDWKRRARRWMHWAVVIVLASFNIALFRHIIAAMLGSN